MKHSLTPRVSNTISDQEKNILVKKTAYYLLLALFISFGMSHFYIDIGFALKPYMVLVVIIFLYTLFYAIRKDVRIVRPFIHEASYVAFLLLVALSFTYSLYPDMSLRLTAGAFVITFTYLTVRTFYSSFLTFAEFRKALLAASFTISVASLIYYFYGIAHLDFNLIGNGISSYGVYLDRGIPRLVGIVSDDPNFSAVFLSVLLLFALTDRGGLATKIALITTFILTFSRGAYLAILVTLVVYILLSWRRVINRRTIKNVAMIAVGASGSVILFSSAIGLNILEITGSRLDSVSQDNGSGRIDKWGYAIQTFHAHPLLGIGANSSVSYSSEQYNSAYYVHNTYLEILSELGLIGTTLYAFSILLALRIAWHCYRHGQYAPILIMICLLVQMVFLSMATSEVYAFALMILYAYLLFHLRKSNRSNDSVTILKGESASLH